MRYKFAESPFLENVPEKLGGAICMQYDDRYISTYHLTCDKFHLNFHV